MINDVAAATAEEEPAAVGLATHAAEEPAAEEASYAAYGYGALAIGAAATVLYLRQKRQEAKAAHLLG